MKKSELKPGMKVVLVNGFEYVVVDDKYISRNGGYMYLARYDDELRYELQNVPGYEDLAVDYVLMYDTVKCYWAKILPEYKIPTEYRGSEVGKESMDFRLSGKSEIWLEGNKTTVLFSPSQNPEETFSGVSTCMEGDTYNKKRGIRIATYRALQKHIENELKKMTK